jgi:2-keto-3-deoxy-L-rhamnonate aldolase RhmA
VTTPDPGARWENPVRCKLRNGEPVFGVTLTTPSLDVAARAAGLGFDFLWIDLEHSPITLETARHIVLATRGLGAMPVARLPVNELWTAKHALDMGMAGVIFPFTSTAALAQQAVEACQYPPAGRRGSGAGLATSSWPEPLRYYDSADANVLIVAIIEEARALDEIEAIAATSRLDALFIGTSDLSFSLGLRGRQDEPLLQPAIERIKDAARRHGKALGRPVGDAVQARQFIDEGFTLFQAASDLRFFERGVREFLEPLARLRAPGDRPLY